MKAKPYYANRLALTSKRRTPYGLNIVEGYGDIPVHVLPATKEAYDQMIEEIAKALCNNTIRGHEAWSRQSEACKREYYRDALIALAAIGIKEPKR